MNLLQIRKTFVDHSGRYDLVNDTEQYADNGADFFINTGLRVLDDKVEVTKNDSIQEVTIEEAVAVIKLPLARAPHTIRIVNDEGNSKFLTAVTYYDFHGKYGENTDEGTPKHYAMFPLRTNGIDAADVKSKAVILGPRPDVEYKAYVKGSFYSKPLTDNEDINFWSIEYPHTLVQAALYAMERFYRNTQGMNDHLIAIERDLEGIDHEEVAHQIQYRSNMSDSFNERLGKYPRNYGV